jgi:hypothetical protein
MTRATNHPRTIRRLTTVALCGLVVTLSTLPRAGGAQNVSVEDYVTRAYKVILNRAPDPSGFQNWTNALRAGGTRQAVVKGFYASPEFQARHLNTTDAVTTVYRMVLCRESDPQGLAYQSAAVNRGLPFQTLVDNFFASPEAKSKWSSCIGVDGPGPAPKPVIVKDAAHGWNDKAGQWERCFGAIGGGCDGAPGADAKKNPDGSITVWVAVGSIMHDECCYANGPSAVWCKPGESKDPGRIAYDEGPGRNGACRAEWDKASHNVFDIRRWRVTLPAYTAAEGGDDLTPMPSRRGQVQLNGRWIDYKGSESPATLRLKAPAGTRLDEQDEAFCASGRFRRPLPFDPPPFSQSGICQ